MHFRGRSWRFGNFVIRYFSTEAQRNLGLPACPSLSWLVFFRVAGLGQYVIGHLQENYDYGIAKSVRCDSVGGVLTCTAPIVLRPDTCAVRQCGVYFRECGASVAKSYAEQITFVVTVNCGYDIVYEGFNDIQQIMSKLMWRQLEVDCRMGV